MRAALLLALLALAACGNPQSAREFNIRQHCRQAAPVPGPGYGHNTQQGIVTQNPGGFMQGHAAGQAKQYAERECLRSYGIDPF
jgi:hypothetical protein